MIQEIDVASSARTYLESIDWETFAEVTSPEGNGDRADLVATQGPEDVADKRLLVVECKVDLSFAVMAQAVRWKPYANYVYVAVPFARDSDGRRFAMQVASRFGFGVLEMHGPGDVRVRVGAPVLSRLSDDLLHSLRPEHKTAKQAGTPGGGHHTPFKALLDSVRQFITDNPGCKADEVIAAVCGKPNHTLERWLRQGRVSGVQSGWKRRLYPTVSPESEEA